jgi:hypothetical protein
MSAFRYLCVRRVGVSAGAWGSAVLKRCFGPEGAWQMLTALRESELQPVLLRHSGQGETLGSFRDFAASLTT